MRQEGHPDSAEEAGLASVLRDNANLRRRMEIYRLLLGLAVFLIIVLLVAHCARYG